MLLGGININNYITSYQKSEWHERPDIYVSTEDKLGIH